MRAASHHARQAAPDFHRLMKELLKSMQIETASNQEPEVYSFKFDGKTEVNIFRIRPDSLDVLVKLGVLHNRKAAATLLNLLAMNRYAGGGWPLNIGMDPVTGMTTLWTRVPLLHLDTAGLAALLTSILDKASSVQSQLQATVDGTAQGIRRGTQPKKAMAD